MHDESIFLVPLTQGKHAIIDGIDAERILCHRWRVDAYGYAIKGGGKDTITMHRFLVATAPGEEVDHINRDKLDNRRCNLRVVTHTQNCVNTEIRRNNTSGFKGVRLNKGQYWAAHIRVNYRQIHLGHFATAEDAARAYDAAAREHFGEFAFLNFTD